MELLAFIGICTIIFLIIKYGIIPFNESKKFKEFQYLEKIKILCASHPKIIEMLIKIDRDQRNVYQSIKYSILDDEYYDDDSGTEPIFGQFVFVFYKHKIEEFKNSILLKVKELELNPLEKEKIDLIVNNSKIKEQKIREKVEIVKLEIKKNYLKYKDELNEIFPTTDVIKTKHELVEFFKVKFKINDELATKIFIELINWETGIIFTSPKSNSQSQDSYWYSKRQIEYSFR